MRYFLDPFGCAKNQVDAETIMALLNNAGWTPCTGAEQSDLIIVNSCGFIEAAKQESINAVLSWKKQYPEKKILLTGCLAQRYRNELSENLPEADGLLGCEELPAAVQAARALVENRPFGKSPVHAGESAGSGMAVPPDETAAPGKAVPPGDRPLLGFPGSAYVKISEGCNNRCSFCAIPLIRGSLRCRSIPDVLEECRRLLERGVVELCLVGQDLASYAPGLGKLLGALRKLPGRFWVRLLYLHPDRLAVQPFSVISDILTIMENDGRFLPYFDIPFQHASPSILAAMNRHGGDGSYLALLRTIRRRLPGAVIRSTLLTGFPGETAADFNLLLDFQAQARFDWLGVFTYSREEGTRAYSMKGRVPRGIALERKARIEERQVPITEGRMDAFVGRTMEVLLEESLGFPGADRSGSVPGAPGDPPPAAGPSGELWLGRLYCHAPEVDGAALVRPGPGTDRARTVKAGGLFPGKITGRAGFDLEVRI
ncbi:MAG: MiaB/RimO family radical SAM methylthiotransferase [Spirochaetaceae bacterium]|jgi:ribosomal protein S12 methylthiotransferase|nr:MiaB/RimO family radical SAM methylthiotransferase [Spirochaetaceae bacterium]